MKSRDNLALAILTGGLLGANFLVFGLLILARIVFGYMSLNYALLALHGWHMAFLLTAIIGFFFAQITIPLAVVIWIIHFFMAFPLIK